MIEKEAVKRFENFHGRKADRVGKVEIPIPKSLVYLGEGVAITYRSDKNVPRLGGRKARTYEHKFGRGVKIFTDPKGQALYIVGGRFKVTDWMRY